MKVIEPKVEVIGELHALDILTTIELAGRKCYKSEDKITIESASKFVRGLIKSGHEAMIEHAKATLCFTCDRGVSHEVVRHRVASYAQESTRYCNYSKGKFNQELVVIDPAPVFKAEVGKENVHPVTGEHKIVTIEMVSDWLTEWACCVQEIENHYMNMVNNWCPAQLARDVLLNSLKTEIVVTMNMREWRHFFNLRYLGTTGMPHPQMRQIAALAFYILYNTVPVVFEDQAKKAEEIGLLGNPEPWLCPCYKDRQLGTK